MEKNYIGAHPSGHWEYSGTLAEIRATNGPEGALGHPTDSRLELRYRGGQWEALENGVVNLDTGAEAVPGALTAPSVNGATVDPSGNVQFQGAVHDFRGLLAVATASPVNPADRISLIGFPTACVGSSSTEQYTSANRPTDLAQAATDGGFGNLQQVYGSPFTVVRGGFLGVNGVGTGPVAQTNSVVDQISQAALLAGAPTVLIYQPRGNDDISTDAGLAQSNYYIEWGIKNALKKGFKKIFLIKSHLIKSKINQLSQYVKSNAFIDSLEERYKGSVFVVGVWDVLSPNGVPRADLLEVTGVHMNAYGAREWAKAWETPLYRAGIIPSRLLPLDLDSLPVENTIINSNNNFMGTTGAYSSTGWAGVAGWSSIAQGPDDPWGRKTTRVAQLGNTAAYLRRTFTPPGAQCVARVSASFLPIRNCGAVGFILRNASDSWNFKPMNVGRGSVFPALENGKWIHYVSDPFLLPTAFFAANSQFNVSIIQGTDSAELAICDVASAGIIKVADTWA